MSKVTELSALATLTNLESLSLATSPAWDAAGKSTTVDSLAPISELKLLSHIELFGIRRQDFSLAELERCHNLKTARFSQYSKEEVERFYQVTNTRNQFIPKPSFGI